MLRPVVISQYCKVRKNVKQWSREEIPGLFPLAPFPSFAFLGAAAVLVLLRLRDRERLRDIKRRLRRLFVAALSIPETRSRDRRSLTLFSSFRLEGLFFRDSNFFRAAAATANRLGLLARFLLFRGGVFSRLFERLLLSRLEPDRDVFLLSPILSRIFSGLEEGLRDLDCLLFSWRSRLGFSDIPYVPAGISIPASLAKVWFLSDSEILGWLRRFRANLRSMSSFSLCVVAIFCWVMPAPLRLPRLFLFFFRFDDFDGGGVLVLDTTKKLYESWWNSKSAYINGVTFSPVYFLIPFHHCQAFKNCTCINSISSLNSVMLYPDEK